MFGLSTTQLLLLAAGAIWLFFSKAPGGGWMEMIRKLLGGGSETSLEDILTNLLKEFWSCGKCSPEEEKKVEEAMAIVINHVVRHRISPSTPQSIESRVAFLENLVKNAKPQ